MQLEAEIEDLTHLTMRQPLDAQVGSVALLEIVESPECDEFYSGSAALLERAYGDDEPNYSEAGTPLSVSR